MTNVIFLRWEIRGAFKTNGKFRIKSSTTIIWCVVRWKDLEKNGVKMACYNSNGRFRSHEIWRKLYCRGEKSIWHQKTTAESDSSHGWRCSEVKDLEKINQLNKAVTSVTTTPKVCKCNKVDICIETTICYIQFHRQIVFLMQFKI